MIENFVKEYQSYRRIGEKALAQVSDDALNRVIGTDNNSVAMIVRHISGNLRSRFTDFLASDGEKPWRDRDDEFAERHYMPQEIDQLWRQGWAVVEEALAQLTDADLERQVTIRGQPHTVHAALTRSLAHVAYHVG